MRGLKWPFNELTNQYFFVAICTIYAVHFFTRVFFSVCSLIELLKVNGKKCAQHDRANGEMRE